MIHRYALLAVTLLMITPYSSPMNTNSANAAVTDSHVRKIAENHSSEQNSEIKEKAECETDAEKGLNPDLAFAAIYTALMGKPTLLGLIEKNTKEKVTVGDSNEQKLCSIIQEYCGDFLTSQDVENKKGKHSRDIAMLSDGTSVGAYDNSVRY